MPTPVDALLVYGNPYYNRRMHAPYGLDVLKTALAEAGCSARVVFPFLFGRTFDSVAEQLAEEWSPRVIGINIRNIDPYIPVDPAGRPFGPDIRSLWFLPDVRSLVEQLRRVFPEAPILLGGTGYSTAPEEIGRFVGCDAGAAGAGESVVVSFVRGLDERRAGESAREYEASFGLRRSSPTAAPPTDYSTAFNYSYTQELPLRTKIGCNRFCSYCTDPLIDGLRVVPAIRSLNEALEGAQHRFGDAARIFITDSEFNLPLEGCHQALEVMSDFPMKFVTQMLPRPFERRTARLLREAGFVEVLLTTDGFDDRTHRANRKSYNTWDALRAVALLHEHGIAPVLQMVFGLPGEDLSTLRTTLRRIRELRRDYPMLKLEFTIGGRIYPGTYLAEVAQREAEHVYGSVTPGLLEPLFFVSPLPPRDLSRLVEEELDVSIPPLAQERDELLAWRAAVAYYSDVEDSARLGATLLSCPPQAQEAGVAEEVVSVVEYALARGGEVLARAMRKELGLPLSEGAGLSDLIDRLETRNALPGH